MLTVWWTRSHLLCYWACHASVPSALNGVQNLLIDFACQLGLEASVSTTLSAHKMYNKLAITDYDLLVCRHG